MRKLVTPLCAFTLLATLAVLSSDVAVLHAQSGVVVLENQFMRISVSASKGALNEILHKPSGVNLRNSTNGAFQLIWGMKVDLPDGTSYQMSNADTTSFASSVSSSGGLSTLNLTW